MLLVRTSAQLHHRNARGATLLAVLVAIVLLTLVVTAGIKISGTAAESAAQHKRSEGLAACTAAARQYVLSQLRTGAVGRSENPRIAGELVLGEVTVRTGHLDEYPDAGVYPSAVQPVGLGAAGSGALDITNTSGGGGFGRQCYLVVAQCLENQGTNKREVEFRLCTAI